MSAPESAVSAMGQEELLAGVGVGDSTPSEVQHPAMRDSFTPDSPACYSSLFIEDCGTARSLSASLLEEEESDDDCLVEIEAEQFYKIKPALHRGPAFGYNMSTSFSSGNENAIPSAAEASYPALLKAETVREEPDSSVRITARAPGGGGKTPHNVEVITIESDDEEDSEDEHFDDPDDYDGPDPYESRDGYYDDYYESNNYGLGDDYHVPSDNELDDNDDELVGHELLDDLQFEKEQFGDEYVEVEHLGNEHVEYEQVEDEHFDDQHVKYEHVDNKHDEEEEAEDEQIDLLDEETEDEEVDLVDYSSETPDGSSSANYPVTSSPADEDNRAVTQSMLAMPDSPFKNAVGGHTGTRFISPRRIAQELYYIPDSPTKKKPEYLSEPIGDTRNWELVLDPATGGVTNYTSTEAERDEMIRLYIKYRGDIPRIRASLPGSNQTTRASSIEVRRIIRILQESHESGLIELLPRHQRQQRQSSDEERRRRKRPASALATDGDEEYRDDCVSGDGYEGDEPVRGPAPETLAVPYDSNDTFDARFARNLARKDGGSDLKRRRGDENIRRRARRDLEGSLGTTMSRLGEVTDKDVIIIE